MNAISCTTNGQSADPHLKQVSLARPERRCKPARAYDQGSYPRTGGQPGRLPAHRPRLADGFHRLKARQKRGKTDIECRVFEGTQRDAVLVALKANSTHGQRRSNADKIRAVQVVLADQEWSKKSTRWIAELCGVGRKLVEELRSQLAPGATHQEEGITTRVCQDGKRRSVRRRSSETLDPVDKALRAAGQFDAWLKRLNKLGEDLERLARGPGGTHLGGVFDRLYEHVRQIMCQVSAARPAARCQFCSGQGCDRCQQHGWLPACGETPTT